MATKVHQRTAFERTVLSDKKLAALPRLSPRTPPASSRTAAYQCVKGLRWNSSDVSRTVLALPCPSGSIKGDVKKKHFSSAARRGYFSDIQPSSQRHEPFPERGSSHRIHRTFAGSCFLRSIARPHCAIKQRDGNCQPWFYLRLVAYGFVGLSEGA